MTVCLDVPYYNGGFTDVFWKKEARAKVVVDCGNAQLFGNFAAIRSLAMQMLYYACNNLPYGTHVHYDSFFCGNEWEGLELILEVAEEFPEEIYVDGDNIRLLIDIPEEVGCCISPSLNAKAKVCLSVENDNISISANQEAYYQMALQLLGMCYTYRQGVTNLQYNHSQCGNAWLGNPFQFTIDNNWGC